MTPQKLSFPKIVVFGTTLLVPCIFYLLLARANVNLPYLDDYDSILGFLNHYSTLPNAGQKALYLFTAQHNEYKLIFEHIVLVCEFGLLDRVDFRLLNILGDISVPLLAIALWKMFLPGMTDRYRRLTLFLPVLLLLFQFQYYDNLIWSTTALQNVPVVAFSLFSLYFIVQNDRQSLYGAFLMLALAVCTSGNGFMVFPVGLLLLIADMRWRVAIAWTCVTAVLASIYFFHYNFHSSQAAQGQSILIALSHFRPTNFLAFLGAAAENAHHQPIRGASVVCGVVLLIGMLYAVRRGYHRRNRFLAAACLFVVLTGLGVAGLRSGNDFHLMLAARYRIYSDLLLTFAYVFFVDDFLVVAKDPLYQRRLYSAAVLVSFVFWLGNIVIGYHSLIKRRNLLVAGMSLYLHPDPAAPGKGPVILDTDEAPDPGLQMFLVRARCELIESTHLDIYQPPNITK